jgi:micrococcal nuclease
MRLIVSLFISFLSSFSIAYAKVDEAPVSVRVTKVIDGDTFDVTFKDSTFRVRLFGIDAPERGQEFYAESKETLAELTLSKQVELLIKGKDKYGRTIATIVRNSDTLNVNREMVKRGMAWHFVQYSDDLELAKLQSDAQQHERGLWSLYHYTAPWDFRKNH